MKTTTAVAAAAAAVIFISDFISNGNLVLALSSLLTLLLQITFKNQTIARDHCYHIIL